MRLKSLQIKGFKSFANDTMLHFNDDVIGIVGPNGSGKSNIVDAIRWVLGEQKSKELRLESMVDVIFNGTKSKKEAASAMVALTFENTKNILPSEYQFITVSRTLYRSGESEYRLNNVVCRLKDITSLFIDTGIGSNSYAIIALGMVDDILENKENARRRMFEQAAGISKYKMRKRETLQKLKNTEEDLNRIEDLLFEIEGNVKILEKQAKRAQKFNDLKEQYKELSIKHAVHAIQASKERYKEVAEILRQKQDEYRENDTKEIGLQALLEKEKKLHLDKEVTLNERQKSLNDLVSKIRAVENEKVLLNQKAGFKIQSKETLTKTIKESDQEIALLQTETLKLKQRIEDEMGANLILKNVLESSKTFHIGLKEKYLLVKNDFDEKQKLIQSLEKEQYEVERDLAILKNKSDNHENEILRTQEDIVLKQKQNEEIKLSFEELSTILNEKNSTVKKLESSENERTNQIEILEKKAESQREKLSNFNRNLDSKQNEYDLLKSMVESFEGYPESIKFLHETWQKDPIILGDILDVEEEYKAAIESYLEPYLNYFVVSTIDEAYQAIQLLGKAQRGKANFFMNSQFVKIKSNDKAPASLTPAGNFVKIDPKYKNLLDFLLNDCYVFDGEPRDIQLLSLRNDDWVILSKHGHFTQTKFTISGGSIGLFEGKKIGRKRNLEQLAKTIQSLQKDKTSLEVEVEKVNDQISLLKQNHAKNTLQVMTEEINQLNQQIVKAQVQLDAFNKYNEEAIQKIKEFVASIKLIDQQIEEKKRVIIEKTKAKELLNSSENIEDSEVNKLSEELAKASEKFNQDNIQLIRHQNLLENLQKDWEYKKSRTEEFAKKLENDRYRFMAEERESIDIADNLAQLDGSLVIMYEEKKKFSDSLTSFEQTYFQTKNGITDLEDSLRILQKEQQQHQQQIQNLKDEFTELKFKINGIGERLKIEFNIPINDIINLEADPSINIEELQENMEKLKARISQFGDVNPLALEAYNEMNDRYESIQKQRNDIVAAKASLMETIVEIENTATLQFQEAFDQIRNNFISVFRELFTDDDTCDLVLENPGQPLESEIEIIAKPKGKKPKSISQLSGGEKTLTATALLFALYLLKPAPFCIFDEVDAPLDDANIQKFNRIVQKFSTESQFIIVTHNKSTMVEVNILYGVYMQEPGISEVSAVDFKNIRREEEITL
ncbi:MAG: chromosome segregation protein SMC [Saprospiraceae bacterium]